MPTNAYGPPEGGELYKGFAAPQPPGRRVIRVIAAPDAKRIAIVAGVTAALVAGAAFGLSSRREMATRTYHPVPGAGVILPVQLAEAPPPPKPPVASGKLDVLPPGAAAAAAAPTTPMATRRPAEPDTLPEPPMVEEGPGYLQAPPDAIDERDEPVEIDPVEPGR